MLFSCALFAGMGASVYRVQLDEPDASPLTMSLIRVAVNLAFVVGIAWGTGKLSDIKGDGRVSLWLRGFFGSTALILSFFAIRAIGIGEASFLHASNGVFVALLSPFVLRQPNSPKAWFAILGALVGLYLLIQPRFTDDHPYGRYLALIAGFLAALAYLMIARAGRSNSAASVVFYFCVVGMLVHGAAMLILPVEWPVKRASYGWLLSAGLCASFAQEFLTRAYQMAPAALNAAVSYMIPVINMALSVLLFQLVPDTKAWIGAFIVLVAGVALPFLRMPSLPRTVKTLTQRNFS